MALFRRTIADPDVEREFMRAMVARASQSIVANLIGIALLLAACFVVPFGQALALALAARVLAVCITAANTRDMVRRIREEAPLDRAVNRFALGMAFAGLTWGGLLWAIPADQVATLSASLVRLVVLSGVALVTLTAAPVRRVMFAYCGAFIAVSGVHMLMLAPSYGFLPLLAGLLIFAAIVSFGMGVTREARQAAETIVDNRRMAETLKAMNEELGAALDQADRLARFDRLTGLANRLSFEEAGERAQLSGTPHHVLIVDLDHFKAINDSAGHSGGDAVLAATGEAIGDALHGLPAGSVAARIGGEEFAILLPALTMEGAHGFASLLCDRIRHVPSPDGYDRSVSASIGLAAWGQDEPLQMAMRRADTALYKAKSLGRDRVELAPLAA